MKSFLNFCLSGNPHTFSLPPCWPEGIPPFGGRSGWENANWANLFYGKNVNDDLTSWLKLAALATAAVPNLEVAELCSPQYANEAHQVSGLKDTQGNRWVLVAPRTPQHAEALDKQFRLLTYFSHRSLPFATPSPAGYARLKDGGRVLVYRALPGETLADSNCQVADVADSLASCLGKLHALPTAPVARCDLPAYTAEQCRQQYLDEITEVSNLGRIPAALKEHWQEALQPGPIWDFKPTVVHGSLEPGCIGVEHKEVVSLFDFSATQVADPALDLAWLSDLPNFQVFLARYLEHRGILADPLLEKRCYLVNELAAMRWLLHGKRSAQQWIIEDATKMLAEIAAPYEEKRDQEKQQMEKETDLEESTSLIPDTQTPEPSPTRKRKKAEQTNALFQVGEVIDLDQVRTQPLPSPPQDA